MLTYEQGACSNKNSSLSKLYKIRNKQVLEYRWPVVLPWNPRAVWCCGIRPLPWPPVLLGTRQLRHSPVPLGTPTGLGGFALTPSCLLMMDLASPGSLPLPLDQLLGADSRVSECISQCHRQSSPLLVRWDIQGLPLVLLQSKFAASEEHLPSEFGELLTLTFIGSVDPGG